MSDDIHEAVQKLLQADPDDISEVTYRLTERPSSDDVLAAIREVPREKIRELSVRYREGQMETTATAEPAETMAFSDWRDQFKKQDPWSDHHSKSSR